MSKLQSAADFHREIQEVDNLIERERKISEEYGSDFASELTLQALQYRRDALERELREIGDDRMPGHELEVVLTGDPIRGQSIESDFLATVLHDLQKVVRSFVAAFAGTTTRKGPIPDDVKARSTLRFAGSFAGSFGMTLEAVDDQIELDLEGGNPLADAFESLMELLSPKDGTDELLGVLAPLGPRARSHYRRLLTHVAERGANMKVYWPTTTGRREAQLRAWQARRVMDVLKRVREETRYERKHGVLTAGNVRRGTFEFQTHENRLVTGRVSRGIMQDLGSFLGHECVATMHVTDVFDSGTGDRKSHFRLDVLEEMNRGESQGE